MEHSNRISKTKDGVRERVKETDERHLTYSKSSLIAASASSSDTIETDKSSRSSTGKGLKKTPGRKKKSSKDNTSNGNYHADDEPSTPSTPSFTRSSSSFLESVLSCGVLDCTVTETSVVGDLATVDLCNPNPFLMDSASSRIPRPRNKMMSASPSSPQRASHRSSASETSPTIEEPSRAKRWAAQLAETAAHTMKELTARKYTLPDKNVASQLLMYRQVRGL